MHQFRQLSEEIVARDAGFVALAAVILMMIGFAYAPTFAFKSAATVALAFSVTLILRASWLTDEGVHRLEAWRNLEPGQRPLGEGGRRWARASFEELLLSTAKTAAGIAIGFYGAALASTVFV